jgi:hypothetical protein
MSEEGIGERKKLFGFSLDMKMFPVFDMKVFSTQFDMLQWA